MSIAGEKQHKDDKTTKKKKKRHTPSPLYIGFSVSSSFLCVWRRKRRTTTTTKRHSLYREEALPFVLNAFDRVSFSSPLVVSSRVFSDIQTTLPFCRDGESAGEREREREREEEEEAFLRATKRCDLWETFEGVIVRIREESRCMERGEGARSN